MRQVNAAIHSKVVDVHPIDADSQRDLITSLCIDRSAGYFRLPIRSEDDDLPRRVDFWSRRRFRHPFLLNWRQRCDAHMTGKQACFA